jgi:hypothetical protein
MTSNDGEAMVVIIARNWIDEQLEAKRKRTFPNKGVPSSNTLEPRPVNSNKRFNTILVQQTYKPSIPASFRGELKYRTFGCLVKLG